MRVMKWGRRTLAMMMVGIMGVSVAASAAGSDGVTTYTPDDEGNYPGWSDTFEGAGTVQANVAKKMIRVVMPTQDTDFGGFAFQLDPNHLISQYATAPVDEEGTPSNIAIAGDATLYFPNKTVESVDEDGTPTYTTVWSDTSDPITAYNKGNVDADITVQAYLKQGFTPVTFSTNDSFTAVETGVDGDGNPIMDSSNLSKHMFMTLQDVNEEYASQVITSAFDKQYDDNGDEDTEAEAEAISADMAEAEPVNVKSITKSIANVKDSWYKYTYTQGRDAHTIGTFDYVANDGIETAEDTEFPSYTFNLRGASNPEADWSGISSAPSLAIVWSVKPGELADDGYITEKTDDDGAVIDADAYEGRPDTLVVGPKASDPTAKFVRRNPGVTTVTVNGKVITGLDVNDNEQLEIPWASIVAIGEDEAPARRIRIEYTDGTKKDPETGAELDPVVDIVKAYVVTY